MEYNNGKGGIHHIAFEVDDVEKTRQEYESRGLAMLEESAVPGACGIIVNFLRYHIQDHAVLVNMAPENGQYQNAFESMKRNEETGRFYPIVVNNEGGQMWVKDALGNQYNVVKTEGSYNRICREYWFTSSGTTFMASDAVVHQIDGALLYEKMTPWKEQLNNKVRRK